MHISVLFLNLANSSILFSYNSICVYKDSICSFDSSLLLLSVSKFIFNLSISSSNSSIFSFNSSFAIIFSSRSLFKSSKLSFIFIISSANLLDIVFFLSGGANVAFFVVISFPESFSSSESQFLRSIILILFLLVLSIILFLAFNLILNGDTSAFF